MENKGRIYAAIDLKSFYASVECAERDLDPLTTKHQPVKLPELFLNVCYIRFHLLGQISRWKVVPNTDI